MWPASWSRINLNANPFSTHLNSSCKLPPTVTCPVAAVNQLAASNRPCGTEPTCGTEASCGVEPGCGVEPSCGIEPSCGAEPTCGIEPKCGVEASCGIDTRQNYSHASGPINYPSQMVSPQMPSHPVQMPARTKPAPKANVKPTPGPMIPAPVPEDSTVDPFRDDAVSHARPRVRAASQRISSHAATPPAEKTLHFDPQAAIRSSQGRSTTSHRPQIDPGSRARHRRSTYASPQTSPKTDQ